VVSGGCKTPPSHVSSEGEACGGWWWVCKGTLQLNFRPLPLHSRSSSVSVTSSVVFLIEPTVEELLLSLRPAVRLPPSTLFILFHFSL